MAYEFFQIPAHGQGREKEELNALLRRGRIASLSKEFVANGDNSYWSFCVETVEGSASTSAFKGNTKTDRVDYKEVLSPEDFAVFSRLRTLRKELAEKDAIPAYSVFTNEQLAELSKARPDSLSGMGKISGVGEARVQKYGPAFLAVLQGGGTPA